MTWQDYLWTTGVVITLLFVMISLYPFSQLLADNSTRKDWGGDEKGKYCEMIQHDITIYPNGTSSGTFKTIKFLCEKKA